jgi:hypothetical protein
MASAPATPAANPSQPIPSRRARRPRPAAPTAASDPTPTIQRTNFITSNDLMVETIVLPQGDFAFLIEGKVDPVKSVSEAGRLIEPPHDLRSMSETGLLRMPTGVAPYGSTIQLLQDIKDFICRYVDLPEEWLDIICLYILMTWVFDRFTAVPYLRFLGEPGTGKTRALQVCASISYKATVASGNITGAALFRTIDCIRGTMAIDEGDFKHSAEWSDITKVLNNGYSPGTPVIRCNQNSFKPEAYYVFGPKIISTRQRFEDEATETRCLTFETQERKVSLHIPLQIPLAFDQEALLLRNKLLQWRFDKFRRISASENGLRDIGARSGQIGASLMAVAPNDAWRSRVVAYLTHADASRRESSPKNLVIQALQNLKAFSNNTATINEIAKSASDLAQEIGGEEMSARKVGGIVRSLGLSPHRTTVGYVVDIPPAEHWK